MHRSPAASQPSAGQPALSCSWKNATAPSQAKSLGGGGAGGAADTFVGSVSAGAADTVLASGPAGWPRAFGPVAFCPALPPAHAARAAAPTNNTHLISR